MTKMFDRRELIQLPVSKGRHPERFASVPFSNEKELDKIRAAVYEFARRHALGMKWKTKTVDNTVVIWRIR